MKNRDFKNFVKGSIFHIYNRGNNKEKIFFDEQDYKAFLWRFGLALGFEPEELSGESTISLPYSRIRITKVKKGDFKLHSFCLMPNHFHLIIEQSGDISISSLMLKFCTSYATYINKKYTRVGYVFQDRFKAVLIDSNPQLMWMFAYIHMNPVKSGLVKNPEDYVWSSYRDFTNERNLPIIEKSLMNPVFESNFKKNYLESIVSRAPLDSSSKII